MRTERHKKYSLRGVARLIAAWRNSRAGLSDIWRSEEAFRLEVVMLAFLTPVSIFVAPNVFHAALLVGSIIFVIIIEVINSAIETTIDRISTEDHELSRTAKDLGSLAVLMAMGLSALLWFTSIVMM